MEPAGEESRYDFVMTPASLRSATERVFGALAAGSVAGFAGLMLTGLTGFEEPNEVLLLVSTVLLVAAPAAVLLHLSLTTELTRDEKHAWMRAFASSRIASAFSTYITSPDRREAMRRLESAARAGPGASSDRHYQSDRT
jgi:ABC-type multidrug transport system permease subunit